MSAPRVGVCPKCGASAAELMQPEPDIGLAGSVFVCVEHGEFAEAPRLHVKAAVPNSFERELAELLNRFSKENRSDTPDFILANYMMAALAAFDSASNARREWYARKREASR